MQAISPSCIVLLGRAGMESNYVQLATEILREELGEDLDSVLEGLYVLLVLMRGERTTLRNVHDAYVVWRTQTNPQYRSRMCFEDLTLEAQELDRKRAKAIWDTTFRLRRGV